MKKIYCIVLLMAGASSIFAQKSKIQFGFAVNAGNYTQRHQTNDVMTGLNYYYSNTTENKPGRTYATGIWAAIPFGKAFRLRADLLYRNANIINRTTSSSTFTTNGETSTYTFVQSQNLTENALVLPLRLEMALGKSKKTLLSVGGGLTRVFAADVRGSSKYDQASGFAIYNSNYPETRFTADQFNMGFNFGGGVFQMIDQHTMIGLEFNFEKTSQRHYNQYSSLLNTADCLCYGYPLQKTPNMRNISVSLRHNILH